MSQGQHPSSWDCLYSGSWEEGHLQAKTKTMATERGPVTVVRCWEERRRRVFIIHIMMYCSISLLTPLVLFSSPVALFLSSVLWLLTSFSPFSCCHLGKDGSETTVFISLFNHSLPSCGLLVLSWLCGITSNAAEAMLDVPFPQYNSLCCPPFR